MKPKEYIISLINAVTHSSRVQHGRERQIISLLQYPDPMCFILHQGTAALYRGKDHLLISNIKAPGILGLNLLAEKNLDHYLQARGEIKFEIISQAEFTEAIKANNLWESLAFSYMYFTLRLVENHFSNVGISTYELVRNNLLALMEENEELRLKTNACDYIQEKTLLSRSGIMKMLGDLKKGGHIVLQRGVLLSINKLPMRY